MIAPDFPTPENQSLASWMSLFKQYRSQIDANTIFIGHSIGAAFALRILESIDVKIKASYLIAGFCEQLGNPNFDPLNETFLDHPFDWEKIRSACASFTVFHSDDDPYVPLSLGRQLADHLHAQLTVVSGAGHFNEKTGYTQFDLLVKKIAENRE